MKFENANSWKIDLGLLILRLFTGFRLLYGVVDNIVSWEKMIEFSAFLESFHFPYPTASAVISVYAQFFAGIFILLGFMIRISTFVMVLNFIIALLFVHIATNDTIEGMTPALALLFICTSLFFTGAGKISMEYYFHFSQNGRKRTTT